MPARTIYRSYPVYHPNREPAGYMDWLNKQEPQIAFDATSLKSAQDWIKAGEVVFNAADLLRSGVLQCAGRARSRVLREDRNAGGEGRHNSIRPLGHPPQGPGGTGIDGLQHLPYTRDAGRHSGSGRARQQPRRPAGRTDAPPGGKGRRCGGGAQRESVASPGNSKYPDCRRSEPARADHVPGRIDCSRRGDPARCNGAKPHQHVSSTPDPRHHRSARIVGSWITRD